VFSSETLGSQIPINTISFRATFKETRRKFFDRNVESQKFSGMCVPEKGRFVYWTVWFVDAISSSVFRLSGFYRQLTI
jgi:hypothetical protein